MDGFPLTFAQLIDTGPLSGRLSGEIVPVIFDAGRLVMSSPVWVCVFAAASVIPYPDKVVGLLPISENV